MKHLGSLLMAASTSEYCEPMDFLKFSQLDNAISKQSLSSEFIFLPEGSY